MTLLIRIHDTRNDRVWFRLANDEDEADRIVNATVTELNPKGPLVLVIGAVELDDSTEATPPWYRGGSFSIVLPVKAKGYR